MARRGPKPLPKTILGALLRSMRQACIIDGHVMEQDEAAALIGVTRQTWASWETEKRGMRAEHLDLWLERSEPYRMWHVPRRDELFSSGLRFRPLPHQVELVGPDKLDVCAPVSDRAVSTAGPTDLLGETLPDASELEGGSERS